MIRNQKSIHLSLLALSGLSLFLGCNKNQEAKVMKPLVVFAQANSQDPWRQRMDEEMRLAYQKHSNSFEFVLKDAEDDPAKQISVVENFLARKPKVVLISPINEAVKSIIEKVQAQKIPVIMLDRKVNTNYTAWVGGNNRDIGIKAGEYLAKRLNGTGTILMVQGTAGANSTTERREGFLEAMKKYPSIQVISGDDCGYQRQKALLYMENFLTSKKPFDAVYCHNDEMAMGVCQAMEYSKAVKRIIIGVDGVQSQIFDYIKQGRVDATFVYPVPGKEAIELALKVINEEPIEKKDNTLDTVMINIDNVDSFVEKQDFLKK